MTPGRSVFPVLSGRVPAARAVSTRGLDLDAFAQDLARDGILAPDCTPQTFKAARQYIGRTVPAHAPEAVYALFPAQFLTVPAARIADLERARHLADARLHPGIAPGTEVVVANAGEHTLVQALLARDGRGDIRVTVDPGQPPALMRLGDDGGLDWTVARTLDSLEDADDLSAFRRYGVERAGPVMTGFAQWALERMRAHGLSRCFGVMREGRHLAEVMRALGQPDGPCVGELWLSRYVALKAAITDGASDALPNLLWRAQRRPLTVRAALAMLSVDGPPDGPFGPDDPVDAARAPLFIDWLVRSGLMAQVLAHAAELRCRLVRHLRDCGALDGSGAPIVLIDMGYAANIQRALETCLRAEAIDVPTVGLYMVTGPGVLWAQREGCRVSGYLTQNGVPEDFMAAFSRTPEVLELCAGDHRGSLMGFGPTGQPELAAGSYPPPQWRQMRAVQEGTLAFARLWAAGGRQSPPAAVVRDRVRALLEAPTLAEAEHIGAWAYDTNGGTSQWRRLTDCAGDPARAGRDELYWPEAARLLRAPGHRKAGV